MCLPPPHIDQPALIIPSYFDLLSRFNSFLSTRWLSSRIFNDDAMNPFRSTSKRNREKQNINMMSRTRSWQTQYPKTIYSREHPRKKIRHYWCVYNMGASTHSKIREESYRFQNIGLSGAG